MKAGKRIKIFQKVGYYEGWEEYQNLPRGWLLVIMKARKRIKIFQKVGYYEGREDCQPKNFLDPILLGLKFL